MDAIVVFAFDCIDVSRIISKCKVIVLSVRGSKIHRALIPIKPIGRFFPQAENGAILNDTSVENIPLHWLPVIGKIKNAYLEYFGEKVHSIYLRGSIPRGMQIDGFSDVDVFALLYDFEERWDTADWQPQLETALRKEYPFVKDIEIMLSQYFKDFYKENPRLSMIIKTQSLCIYGKDLSEEIPSFFPNKKMILNLTWLSEDLNNFLQKGKITKGDCREITKLVIRSGFELVMEKEGKYTTDLYLCYQVFSKYFPQKEKEMKEILHYYLNPNTDFVFSSKKIEVLGKWIIQQI